MSQALICIITPLGGGTDDHHVAPDDFLEAGAAWRFSEMKSWGGGGGREVGGANHRP